MALTLRQDKWSPVVPYTKVPRIEAVTLMMELKETTDKVEKHRLFLALARLRVLTTGQLATLLGITRQRVYIKLMQEGIEYSSPPRAKIGNLDLDYLHAAVTAVRVLQQDPSALSGRTVQDLKKFAPVGVVYHLTGVDVSTGTIR